MSAEASSGKAEGTADPSFDFDKAVADIQRAAEILAQPESKQAFQAIQDAVKAVTAVQDAMKAVAVQDAVKAVAVQDAVKAVAVQDAVKAVAGVIAGAREDFRTAISQEIENAVQMIRDAARNAGRTPE